MVKFLVHRPIAVIMTFIAILLLGAVAAGLLPVSLMPNIDIPEITVQVEREGISVRELENTVVQPLRQSLMQVIHLNDISSETREGHALIHLRFKYGTDINYAFIDANEKVDAVMRYLPKELDRPSIIKANATDLPVFYINVRPREENAGTARFMELCEFTDAVIRKRIEQLPQVAMVDITGMLWPELYIQPDQSRMDALGLSQATIQNVLRENNITVGSLQVIDGQYQYNIRFSNALRDVEDVKNIYLKINDRIFQLREIAEIGLRPRSRDGLFMQGNKQALCMAIVKQSDARMDDLKFEVDQLLGTFKNDFPEVEMTMTRDQTGILKYAIDNLKQNLLIGGLLAFLIMFFFLKDTRSPLLIGLSIPVSLVLSLLLFYLIGMSLNIISLSGLILGVGMMIDNSIIVIDNITQRMDRGEKLTEACIAGTNEVIRPLLSSVLTTCAVFIPLIFISGISGALFYDQAIAVTIGLFVSLVVAVTLLPVLYRLIWLRSDRKGSDNKGRIVRFVERLNLWEVDDVYEKGWHWAFRHKNWMWPVVLFLLISGAYMAWHLPKERFPSFEQKELVIQTEWNERINLAENQRRVEALLEYVKESTEISSSFVGRQQFILQKDMDLSGTESLIYLKLTDIAVVKEVQIRLQQWFNQQFPLAEVSFRFPETIFERLFADQEAPFVARVSSQKIKGVPELSEMESVMTTFRAQYNQNEIGQIPADEFMEVRALPEKLSLYEVDQGQLYSSLKSALNEYQIGILRSKTLYVPIVISDQERSINTILRDLKIRNKNGSEIPVNQLVTLQLKTDYKIIHGGKEGEYVKIPFQKVADISPDVLSGSVRKLLQDNYSMNVSFVGSIFSSRVLINELIIVMIIGLALLYFILAAQFESFSQPLIVLLEVPLDIAGALGMLWLWGGSINVMSMIGIVIMSGIIINDSILKVDTINQLRKQGMGLLEAIETGGNRRLKPILMTSLTTILAIVPFLFSSDMGSQLQQPLSLTLIGGMVLGTFISLYFVPIFYYYLYRNTVQKTVQYQNSDLLTQSLKYKSK